MKPSLMKPSLLKPSLLLLAVVVAAGCGKVTTKNDGGGDDDDDVIDASGDDDDDDDDDVVFDAMPADAEPPDDAPQPIDAAEPDAPIVIVGLEITPSSPASFPLGTGFQLEATAHYSDGDEQNVTDSASWDTGNSGIAVVDLGYVGSNGVGTTFISAAYDGVSDSVSITVDPPALLDFYIDQDFDGVEVGQSVYFTATGQYTNGTYAVTDLATWESADDFVAYPTGPGVFQGNAEGFIDIFASLDGFSDSAQLEVTLPPLGTSPGNPGHDCTHLRDAGITDTGVYWIDPDADGDGSDSFQAFCDMTTDGGGWTLIVWADSGNVGPAGIPYPGLAACNNMSCARGSIVGDPYMEQLVQRSTEFGLGSSDAAGESIQPLGDFQYAGKYTYGSLAGMDLQYAAVACGTGSWTGVFRSLVGPTTYDNATVYLSQFLAYSSYNFGSDSNSYIYNVGAPVAVCDGSGAMPGSWSGTWSTQQYGPYNLSGGRRAVFVRGGTAPGGIGSNPSNPGLSCLHILQNGGSVGDGLYWIDPQDTGAFQVRCDMTTDGGGWTVTYDVTADYFDGVFLNNFTSQGTPPLSQNQQSDIWNAESVMPVAETLLACGQQNNAALYYWRYNTASPHTFIANTATDYTYQNATASTASNGNAAGCMAVHKAGSTFGFAVSQTTGCGNCQGITWGMYHYISISPGCNSTSTTYGTHASPYNARQIQYPVCNQLQTSNGRFWMGVR